MEQVDDEGGLCIRCLLLARSPVARMYAERRGEAETNRQSISRGETVNQYEKAAIAAMVVYAIFLVVGILIAFIELVKHH